MGQRGIIQKIADECGVNQASVRRALKDAGEDIANPNFEKAVQIVRAVADSARISGHAANGRGEGGDESRNPFVEAKARAELARARKIELQVARDEGKLIDREAVAGTGEAIIAHARAAILSLGHRVAPQLIGKTDIREIATIIEGEARIVLKGIADPDAFLAQIDEALG
jgi:hypothetical protein